MLSVGGGGSPLLILSPYPLSAGRRLLKSSQPSGYFLPVLHLIQFVPRPPAPQLPLPLLQLVLTFNAWKGWRASSGVEGQVQGIEAVKLDGLVPGTGGVEKA